MATKKCPVCGVSVKVENLERHMKNQHPRAHVDLSETLTEEEQEAVKEKKAAARPAMTRRGRRIVLVAGVIVVVVLVLIILNPFAVPKYGDFTLPTSTGGTFTLSSLRGHVVFMEFMDVDCPYCQEEAPTLSQLYANFSSRVAFLSVDINFEGAQDTAARINTFRAQYNNPWTYVMDSNQVVAHQYGVSATPTMMILNTNLTVAQTIQGVQTYAALSAALTAVLGG